MYNRILLDVLKLLLAASFVAVDKQYVISFKFAFFPIALAINYSMFIGP